MFFYSKKLIKCCKCNKKYSFDDNLFHYNKNYILQCPYCGLQHKVDISLLSQRYGGLKRVEKLELAEITIGNASNYGNGSYDPTHILVDLLNPANGTGTITEIHIRSWNGLGDVVVGILEETDTLTFTSRDHVALGNIPNVYSNDSIELDVEEGDYIGLKMSSGSIRFTNAESGTFRTGRCISSETFPITDEKFSGYAYNYISIGGTGETGGGEVSVGNPLFMFQNFITGFAKIL